MSVASWWCKSFFVVPCASFCTDHFVMVPLNMTYLHCLQHSLFEHLCNLYSDKNSWMKKFTHTSTNGRRTKDCSNSSLSMLCSGELKVNYYHKIICKNYWLLPFFFNWSGNKTVISYVILEQSNSWPEVEGIVFWTVARGSKNEYCSCTCVSKSHLFLFSVRDFEHVRAMFFTVEMFYAIC